MSNLHISQKLAVIQQKLKAPKGQVNKFGGYRYRSCEDILEAVKPLLGDCVLTISDDIREIGGRVYVEATARLGDSVGGYGIEVKALAREPESKKGMDESQITGAASSYARKYALNGLFCIDDTKDADATNDHKDPVIDESQLAVIYDLLDKTDSDADKFCKAFNIQGVEQLSSSQFDKALGLLKRKLKNENK
jgi:hypothetical protein